MNNGINYDNLARALALYEEEWLAALPSEAELERMYTFSPRFERRMARLFSRQRKPYYPYIDRAWKRALLAAAISLLILAAGMSASAIREPILRFVIVICEKFSSLFYHSENEIEKEIAYRPAYLPEGFAHTGSETIGVVSIQRYENAEGAVITFRQYPLRKFEIQADTEGAPLEEILINGHQGIFYQNKDWNTLMWSDNGYTFTVVARIDKTTMEKIANSIETAD